VPRFLDIDGVTLHVRDDGPPGAPALLLVHSLGTSVDVWDAQARALARSFRVIRYDLRGHGLSEVGPSPVAIERFAADGVAILDALGVTSVHVGGISIGGLVAIAIAAQAPARVRSLMVFDSGPAFPPPEGWHERAALIREHGPGAIADEALLRWVGPQFAVTAAGRGLRAILERTPAEGYARGCEALAAADLTEAARRIAVPTLIAVGELDASLTLSNQLVGLIPGSRLAVITGGYHLPIVDHADAATRAMLDHLGVPDGPRVRAEVLGADHVARMKEATTDLDRDFQVFISRIAWGELWTRPHFDRRTRSIVTLALLAGLGRDEEFAVHVRAMRNTGATAADLAELLLHVAVYAGVPAANAAMRVAKRVLAETP
jgi:3-oxoadipate enol-lactonase/4-carboxymuconolactone decarboxylase